MKYLADNDEMDATSAYFYLALTGVLFFGGVAVGAYWEALFMLWTFLVTGTVEYLAVRIPITRRKGEGDGGGDSASGTGSDSVPV